MMRTRLLQAMGFSLLAGSIALSVPAQAAEGLYSADDLLDAEVYDSNGEEVGEVEDVLMGNDMALHSLIIKTDDVLGLGGRDLVAERGTFTVRLAPDDGNNDFDDHDYQVHMEGTHEDIAALPEYDASWWNRTSDNLQQAWENTKDISESAWESTKQATSSAWYNIRKGAEKVSEEIEDATN